MAFKKLWDLGCGLPVEWKLVKCLGGICSCPEKELFNECLQASQRRWDMRVFYPSWLLWDTLTCSRKLVSSPWESSCMESSSGTLLQPATSETLFNSNFNIHLFWVAGIESILLDQPALRHNFRIVHPLVIRILKKYTGVQLVNDIEAIHIPQVSFHHRVLWTRQA